MIKCRECGFEKPLSEYYLRKDTNKYRTKCKECTIEAVSKYRNNNRSEYLLRSKKYYYENHEILKKKKREFWFKNKYKINKRRREKYNISDNRRTIERQKEYYKQNFVLVSKREKERYKYKRNNNPYYRLNLSMSTNIRNSLKGNKNGRRWEDLIGYTQEDLRKHLEIQFRDGMTWDNYGKWHIDHIVPISLFNIISAKCKGFRACWALDNLRPLWAKDNLKKHAKLFV